MKPESTQASLQENHKPSSSEPWGRIWFAVLAFLGVANYNFWHHFYFRWGEWRSIDSDGRSYGKVGPSQDTGLFAITLAVISLVILIFTVIAVIIEWNKSRYKNPFTRS